MFEVLYKSFDTSHIGATLSLRLGSAKAALMNIIPPSTSTDPLFETNPLWSNNSRHRITIMKRDGTPDVACSSSIAMTYSIPITYSYDLFYSYSYIAMAYPILILNTNKSCLEDFDSCLKLFSHNNAIIVYFYYFCAKNVTT